MASVQESGMYPGVFYYPECPYADNNGVSIKNYKCSALTKHPGAFSGIYWCAVAQQYDRCPIDKERK